MFMKTLFTRLFTMIASAKKLVPSGIRKATRTLLDEIYVFVVDAVNRAGASARYRNAAGLKVQLGCGPRVKQGWVNIDLAKTADVRLDLRRKLPFPDNSCTVIYSEHFLEHLDYPEPVRTVFKDCLRVLQPGGQLTFAVPDIDLVMRTYVHGGPPEYYAAQKRWSPSGYTTQIEYINFNFRQNGEHRFAYDEETMTKLLQSAGFTNVRRREFDPALDSKDRIVGSLYMNAMKG
jgi:predicted SAM-dependent methyltransferase